MVKITPTAIKNNNIVGYSTMRLWFNTHCSDLLYTAPNLVATQLSFSFLDKYLLPESNILHNSGVIVIATTNDINNDTMYAIPSGLSIRPSIPVRKNKGIKVTMIINVALTMELRISDEASNTTLNADLRSPLGKR